MEGWGKKAQFETLLRENCRRVGGRYPAPTSQIFFVMGCTFGLSQDSDNSHDERKIIYQDSLQRFLLKFSGALCLDL